MSSSYIHPDNDFEPSATVPSSDNNTFNPVPVREEVRKIETMDNPRDNGIDPASPDTDKESDIALLAKSYKPLIKKIVDVLDATGVRLVCNKASAVGYGETEVEQLAGKVQMQDETHDLLVEASSRVAARNIKNPEVMDYLAISGALLEWGSGIVLAIRELGKITPLPPNSVTVSPGMPTEPK